MSRIYPLFSGSDGNATLISSGETNILIDAGVSFRRLNAALLESGVDIDSLSAVFVTHEHTDHIQGLKTLLKSAKIPVFASPDTLNTLIDKNILPKEANATPIEDGVEIHNIFVSRFATSHDCSGSSGYVLKVKDGQKVAVCTDLGFVSDEVRSALLGCDTVLIESNHDVSMLQKGPYPPQLKMRILSDKGHLSNNVCAAELPSLLRSGTKRIILGHISKNNNNPMLAINTARTALNVIGAQENVDYLLYDARPQDNGVIVF
ncbi:MAG: MBL fold metallo-hydrolase [Clostridia bacterium]|nr:MBL fold metallo-hydrolase [Clostridia bacterium]MBP3706708.1 MBL fold metallo-hydrolase [Clostridia bacterium]